MKTRYTLEYAQNRQDLQKHFRSSSSSRMVESDKRWSCGETICEFSPSFLRSRTKYQYIGLFGKCCWFSGKARTVLKLAIAKLTCGFDYLNWRIIRIEILFQFTGIDILYCSWNSAGVTRRKTVDCIFYQTSQCKEGVNFRFRHSLGGIVSRTKYALKLTYK